MSRVHNLHAGALPVAVYPSTAQEFEPVRLAMIRGFSSGLCLRQGNLKLMMHDFRASAGRLRQTRLRNHRTARWLAVGRFHLLLGFALILGFAGTVRPVLKAVPDSELTCAQVDAGTEGAELSANNAECSNGCGVWEMSLMNSPPTSNRASLADSAWRSTSAFRARRARSTILFAGCLSAACNSRRRRSASGEIRTASAAVRADILASPMCRRCSITCALAL